jgi:hypothetical protein
MIDRRTLVAGALAAPLSAQARDAAVKGSRAYSESIMVMSVAADGSSAVTLRFCRFPVEGYTWVWCHVLVGQDLYAFTRHDLPAGPERLADGQSATYLAPPLKARLAREGRGPGLSNVRLSADLGFHKSRTAPLGDGPVRGRIEGRFTAERALVAQVLEGRDEVYGRLDAEIRIGGRRLRHTGPAKFHEQRQEAPRFDTPFCYGWLAGADRAATSLLVNQGAAGGWILGGRESAIADLVLDPPGQTRAATWKLKDAPALPGRFEALTRYEIPIHGRAWQGSFVRGEVGGAPVVGVLNDWPGPPDICAAARSRA